MTEDDIKALVTEGATLSAELAALKEKSERLDEIKAVLRKEAGKDDKTFTGANGETAQITHTKDGIARTIRGPLLPKVMKLAGDKLWDFFQLAPIPAKELPQKDLRVQVLTDLPKGKAKKLLDALTVESTPRVSFSAAPAAPAA